MLTQATQRQPKRPRSPSPALDLYQLLDSEQPNAGNLDLSINIHHVHILPDVMFPKKIPHQRQLMEAQRTYLSNAIDELLAANIFEPIRPEDVKCASPITLTQKVHSNLGLSFDKLRHRVNEECISHGLPPAHNVEPPVTHMPTLSNDMEMAYDPTQPQKWWIFQNYGALNRVTHVFPMLQGDICTKQRRLSRHW